MLGDWLSHMGTNCSGSPKVSPSTPMSSMASNILPFLPGAATWAAAAGALGVDGAAGANDAVMGLGRSVGSNHWRLWAMLRLGLDT